MMESVTLILIVTAALCLLAGAYLAVWRITEKNRALYRELIMAYERGYRGEREYNEALRRHNLLLRKWISDLIEEEGDLFIDEDDANELKKLDEVMEEMHEEHQVM